MRAEAISAIASCVVAAGIFIAVRQLRQAKRSTNAQVAIQLFRELRDKQILKTIRDVIYATDREAFNHLNNETREEIGQVLDRLDMLGGLVKKQIVDEDLAISTFAGPTILRCWYQMGEHYINNVRQKRGQYAENIEDLAKRALKYEIGCLPKSKWTRLHRGTPEEIINVVEGLRSSLLSKREFFLIKCKITLASVLNQSLREKI
jgi:hypothetical protein